MGHRRMGSVLGHLRVLMDVGALGGVSDRELLERFCGRDGAASETAFRVLVERHGPMVLRVCRSVLKDEHAANDAFQATFLVLARRAPGVWIRDSLGPWLHGVAYRTAASARSAESRRRRHEHKAAKDEACGHADGFDDLGAVLHEEVNRLSKHYRAPVVLCYLEGLTHDQAAVRLGWPVGTVRTRLSKAREVLRGRLARRGVVPATAFASWLAFTEVQAVAGASVVPWSLINVTVQAGLQASARATTVGVLAWTISHSLQGVITTMILHKLQFAGLAFAVVAAGAVVAQRPGLLPAFGAQVAEAADEAGKSSPGPDVSAAGEQAALAREMHAMTLDALAKDVSRLRAEIRGGIEQKLGLERRIAKGKNVPMYERELSAVRKHLEESKMDYIAAGRELERARHQETNAESPAAVGKNPLVSAGPEKRPEGGDNPAKSVPGGAGMAVGSVDLDRVMKECETLRASKKQIEAAVAREREKLNGMNARAQELGNDLAKVPTGSPEHLVLERKILEQKQRYEVERELAQRDLASLESQEFAAFYERIQDVVAKVARAKGLTYVVRVYPKMSLAANSSGVSDALAREVLYADSRYDLTEDVIHELNAKREN